MSEDHSWPRTSSCSGDMHTFIWAGSGKMPDGIPCSCGAIRSGINNVTKDDDLTALRAENERLKTELKTEKLVWAVKEDQMRDNFQKCKDVAEHWKKKYEDTLKPCGQNEIEHVNKLPGMNENVNAAVAKHGSTTE